jgi:hypothetical protein
MCGYGDSDIEYEYIGKEKSFIANGKEIVADCTLSEWIRNIDTEYIEFEIEVISRNIGFDNAYAIDFLADELLVNMDYMNRIFNSETPIDEIYNLINESAIYMLDLAMCELKNAIHNVKVADWR